MLLVLGCANRGMGPQGGPKDTTPPKVLKETPSNGTLNYSGDGKLEIVFDEYLQLDDVSKNVLISPPQQHAPEVKAIGKKVTIAFDESFQDSTTYTIDFGNAICDFHEKNPIKGYTLSFSTCDWIDSLEVSGYLVNASDLNPASGVIIGIQRNLDDSAFSTLPFTRVARTDETGYFNIKNIAIGTYRLYALNDVSRDYLYQPGEALAFYDSLVTPTAHIETHYDTLWIDSIQVDSLTMDTLPLRLVDTIHTHTYTYFEPSDVVLWYFQEDKQRVYFKRCYREQANKFWLQFSAPMDTMPTIRSLAPSMVDSTKSDSAWVDWMDYALIQHSTHYDTITVWLTDSAAIGQDSIFFEMTYLKSDSLYNLQPQTDTIRAIYRAPRISEKARAKMNSTKSQVFVEVKSNAKSSFDIYQPLILTFATPVDSMWTDSLLLYQKVDTVLQPLSFTLVPNDSVNMSFRIDYPWKAEQKYQLQIDSAVFKDVYGNVNKETKFDWKIRSLEEYSSLTIKLTHWDASARLQLLDEKETVIKELPALPDGTVFKYLAPKAYYVRLYIDWNGDEKWTPGDWLTKRQPEPVYYFPSKMTLRANWDFEEEFDHLALPQLDGKPQELLKDISTTKK